VKNCEGITPGFHVRRHPGNVIFNKYSFLLVLITCLGLSFISASAAEDSVYLESPIGELVQSNFSGRVTESLERVGYLLAADPGDYRAYFIRAACYGWLIAVSPENRRYHNQFVESLKACIKHSSKVKSSSPEYSRALFFKALALVAEARFKAIRGNYISSRWATRGAKDTAEELVNLVPQDIDAWFPLAVFHYFWGGSSVWKRAAQFMALVPRGKRELGLSLLEDCAAKSEDSRLWANAILLMVYMEENGSTEKALKLSQRMIKSYPDNAILHLALADCYRKLSRWENAETAYRSITAKVLSRVPSYDETVFEISRLRTVESQVELGKMDEAFAGVRSILISNPMHPEWILPWAHLFTSRIYRHQGEWERAERACRYALDSHDYYNLHEHAKKELKEIETNKDQE
jgi:tetratricopeptide (TPR) repeat protein